MKQQHEEIGSESAGDETDFEERTPEAQAELCRNRADARARMWSVCRETCLLLTTLSFGTSTAVLAFVLSKYELQCRVCDRVSV
jgi:hypothetical protein